MKDLEKAFHNAMVSIYERCKDECNYKPVRFLKMVADYGGLEAARRLLYSPVEAYGFTKLWELGRLDLSMEALILQHPWNQLFTEEEKTIARNRLREYGFIPDRVDS